MLIYLKAHIKRNQPWLKSDTTIVFSKYWSMIAGIRGFFFFFFFVDVSTEFSFVSERVHFSKTVECYLKILV